jgi:cysteine desulfurase
VSQIAGGGQERQRRAGTENVPGIVGQAVALSLAEEERPRQVARLTALRDRLTADILAAIPDARLNGHPDERLANNVNISFRGVRGDELVLALDKAGIATSAGAACGSLTWEPSHVLLAMGLSMLEAVGGLRITLSGESTDSEADELLRVLPETVAGLRAAATTTTQRSTLPSAAG